MEQRQGAEKTASIIYRLNGVHGVLELIAEGETDTDNNSLCASRIEAAKVARIVLEQVIEEIMDYNFFRA